MAEYIAHIRQDDQEIQTVETHLLETAQIAKQLANKLDLDLAGELLGLMHDFGKYSFAFQQYISSVTGFANFDFDEEEIKPNSGKVDHSTAGAQWVYCRLRTFANKNEFGELCGQILGLCIASHHGQGLIDCLDLNGESIWRKRFQKEDKLTHLTECQDNADSSVLEQAEKLSGKDLLKQLQAKINPILTNPETNFKIKEFYLGCLTRFLFSCLIDADRINSADFEHQHQTALRRFNQPPNWQEAIDLLENKIAQFQIKYPIDHIRKDISDTCLKRAHDPQDSYTLTVPTGGGKTLASLRYALHHAQKHNLDRIIYVIPYTSIIEQNAEVVRDILGDDWVLEHHSNLDPEQQTWQNKMMSENWDKPIVFTTMVQFLDAWFGSGTRGARHIHPMTRSVLIFDEIQTLPIKCVHLFCNVLNWLTQYGKSSAILCTATQPLLDKLPKSEFGELILAENSEIMGESQDLNQLFNDLSRVNIQHHFRNGGWSLEEAGAFLLAQFEQHQSCLFVVNTKKWAKVLYQYCKKQHVPAEALFHLSTNQCSVHRKVIFDEIKRRLKNKEPVICISTQLIEAGVDISMACVIRALGGLDSIAQAAGRCNRHGEKKGKGQVYILNLQEPSLAQVLPDISIGQEKTEQVFRECAEKNILKPAAIERYFELYFYNRRSEMVYQIGRKGVDNLLNLLSDNCLNKGASDRSGRLKNDILRENDFKPLLMQSFKSAGQAFQVIDAPTRSLIVPYGEGEKLITKLCGEWNPKEMYRILVKAQRYSVNVFPNIWQELERKKAIHEVQIGSGIYYLIDEHYTQEYGLSIDEVGEMPFLCS